MNIRFAAIAVILAAALAAGCSKNAEPVAPPSGAATAPGASAGTTTAANPMPQASASDADAVRAAIEDHLRNDHSINMVAMDMTVDSVSINGDQAQANAAFHLKQGGTGMVMTYSLQRHATGWLVMHSQPADGQFVHPPMDKSHSGAANPSAPAAPSTPDVSDFLRKH
ncbi:MAG TPA: hypothetical protein VN822_14485 [Candidatus Acidoferrales bacterium]|nr:hypothetical protein [Candidatus Acidoferrales bacterium]